MWNAEEQNRRAQIRRMRRWLCDNTVPTAVAGGVDQSNPTALRSKLGILDKCSFCCEDAWAEKNDTHGYKNDLVNFDNAIVLVRLELKP